MGTEGLTCRTCGSAFSLPETVRKKYPGWAPKECMHCRDGTGEGAAGRPAGTSVTRQRVLGLAEVLERFEGGPQTGVFTDGSCQGNPGPGGWGAVRVRDGILGEQRHGFEQATTNNRMELTAMIEGLSMVGTPEAVDIYSDSLLVVNTLTKWAKGWEAAGWKRREGAVKNLDLVQRAYELVRERPRAHIQWIRAHDGSRWNEYADALSTAHLRGEL
ncbi:MAG: ribonuclease H family protein [Tepidiformaceae bacterium]